MTVDIDMLYVGVHVGCAGHGCAEQVKAKEAISISILTLMLYHKLLSTRGANKC